MIRIIPEKSSNSLWVVPYTTCTKNIGKILKKLWKNSFLVKDGASWRNSLRYTFFIKRSILNVCLGSECFSEYYPYCELQRCSSSCKNTNEMATTKKSITMTISSGGFTKQKHCLQKHCQSINLKVLLFIFYL